MVGVRGQSKVILDHLRRGKAISSKEAFEEYGVTRLSGHIWHLRKHGFDIRSVTKHGNTRYGTPCVYALYYLVEHTENNNEGSISD